jgi:hypothetical protein
VALVLLLACCGGVIAVAFAAFDSRHYSTGDCIRNEKSGDDSKAVKVDCSDDGAHKIVAKLDDTTERTGCPASTTDATFVDFNARFVLCLSEVK